MYDIGTRQRALTLLRSGAKNAAVARTLNIPPGTIGSWKHADRAKRGECPGRVDRPLCPRCDGRELDEAAYAYLLGLYLGDGHISHPRQHRVPSLRITLDDAWPGVQQEAMTAVRTVFPDNTASWARKTGCRDAKVHSKHLVCLFPQHGPGKKHERAIVLEPWQREIVDAHPWPFVRGLIHSDGSRVVNWTEKTIGGRRKRYEYPRYFFTNTSDDIARLYTDTLDRVGVAWRSRLRATGAHDVSVARRDAVALLDAHVGPKH
ncbi:helix-turn-helix domain-containing protein [Streptomyces sp. NBC_00691]|uniref:helix-turn-helix domain-containing protein n=1 Tax=Streptomyces sp. NBC_00691 TaxID=2903671 RepID=UPI002E31A774|nr:helix-turn-helix domain-containing protein [Streptomyces sp. NBC_00691]